MVEHGGQIEAELIEQIGKYGDAQETYLKTSEDGGIKSLAEVEAEGGGDIQVRVHVVHVVETPDKGIDVVGPVPVIERKVQIGRAHV